MKRGNKIFIIIIVLCILLVNGNFAYINYHYHCAEGNEFIWKIMKW